jgi:TPR repeat protein
MKCFISVLFLSFFLIPVVRSRPQQSPPDDPMQAELIATAHFEALTAVEQTELLLKAQSGDAESQYWLGVLYTDRTVSDLEEGRRWVLKAAEQGYARAERLYGFMTEHVNPSIGRWWLLRAAEQGDAEAQFRLGTAYEQTGSEGPTQGKQ